MGRPTRQDPAGGWHHVYNRGIRKTPIFLDDQHRLMFLRSLEEAAATHEVLLHCFCLVGNHYHLLVSCPEGGLSDVMHDAAGQYSSWFNHRNDTDGPLCRSRFGSRLLETDQEVLVASAYVHRNALDIAPHTPLAHYRWSSAAQYLDDGAPSSPDLEVCTEEVLALAGSHRQYWRMVGDGPATVEELRRHRAAEAVTKRLAEISARVAVHYTCSAADVRSGRAQQARRAALLLAVSDGVPRSAIASHLGYSGQRSVNSALRRLRTGPGNEDVWSAFRAVAPVLGLAQSRAA